MLRTSFFLLYLWDGNYASGTLPASAVGKPIKSDSTPSAPSAPSASAALIELLGAASASVSAAVSVGDSAATRTWFTMLNTQLWFMALTTALILLSLLYAYGSLRLRCKRLGKWGSSLTSFWLLVLAVGTIMFGALTLKFHPALVASTWARPAPPLLAIAAQIAVAVLIAATAVYQLFVSTQVNKLKIAAVSSFNTLLVLTFVSAAAVSVCYFTYYEALRATPRANLLFYTALTGVASQVMLFCLGVQLVAWRYAIGEEYITQPVVETFLLPDGGDGPDQSPFPAAQQQD